MKHFMFTLFCLVPFAVNSGQTPVGTWTDHLNYSSAYCIAVSSREVFASTGASVLVYNKDNSELRKLSKVNGLTETGISSLAYSEDNQTLVIGYTSTNIDLVKDNTVYNIPDILNKLISGKKSINRIRVNGRFAYAACSFGLVVIDLVKKEIHDTWYPLQGKDEIYDVAFAENQVFAATGKGMFRGDAGLPGLAWPGNWKLVTGLPDPYGRYDLAAFTGGSLYVSLRDISSGNDRIYKVNSGSAIPISNPAQEYLSIDVFSSGFIATAPGSIQTFNTDGLLQSSITGYGWAPCNAVQAIKADDILWIADKSAGLISGNKDSGFTALNLKGPASNNFVHVSSSDGKTIVTGGGMNLSKNLSLSVHEDNTWTNISSENIKDPVRSVTDPRDRSHFFVTTWGDGLLEYRGDILEKQSHTGEKLFGMAMDEKQNLWVTHGGSTSGIMALKPDGSWIETPYIINASVAGDIIIARDGSKWVIIPGQGLWAFDDRNTPDNFTDDRVRKFAVTDEYKNSITNVLSIAPDQDGKIWVGTDKGLLIYYNPEKIFESDLPAYRIKIPRNDGTNRADYMLETETITSISIDGANRKWIGTASSGVYLLSADGTGIIHHYNKANSPVLSDNIKSIAADNIKGNVWIGTSEGLVSVRETAISGKENYSGIYAFPNPVRHDFSGNVSITGLVSGSEIKITDVSGNLVYETVSQGGMASWNLEDHRGSRVSTGVYIVFCSSPDGKQSAVTKILVIK